MLAFAIDRGNTQTKIGVFSEGKLVDLVIYSENENWADLAERYQPEAVIVSNVRDEQRSFEDYFPNCAFSYFQASSPIPIKNNYESPNTLGSDRLATALGAASLFPGKSAMIIDAGSCLTMDVLSKGDTYEGGSISPGLQMRFKALHTFTGKLPLVEADENYEAPIAKNTRAALLSGVQQGLEAEVLACIRRYEALFGPLQILLCGGDAPFLEHFLKNSIFAPRISQHPHLALYGLHRLLS